MLQVENSHLIVAVGGASSSGKTRLLRSLKAALGRKHTTHLDLDGYHKHDRKRRLSLGEFPEELRANDFDQIANDVKKLRQGAEVRVPTYNHNTGQFGRTRMVKPHSIIFIEGLHAVALNSICNEHLIDVSIFLDPEEDLRRSWKVHRDVFERSYTYENAVLEIQRREPAVLRYILCQRDMADILLHISSRAPRSLYHTLLVRPTFVQNMQLQNILSLSSGHDLYKDDGLYADFHLLNSVRHKALLDAADACEYELATSAKRLLATRTRAGSFRNAMRFLVGLLLGIIMVSQVQEVSI